MLNDLTLCLRGNISAIGMAGQNLLPPSQMERALILLLAFGDDHRRSRKWLQSTLWSTRNSDQASSSLRSMIYKIRNMCDFWKTHLKSDRNTVWFDGKIAIEFDPSPGAQLLEDIAVSDPAFTSWLNELRFRTEGVLPDRELAPNSWKETVHIRCIVPQSQHEARFLSNYFIDSLASALRTSGDIEVEFPDQEPTEYIHQTNTGHIIEVESALVKTEWFVHARVFQSERRNFVWSGRLRLPMDLAEICNGPQVPSFVGRIISAIVAKTGPVTKTHPYFAIQGAAQKLFLGDRAQLDFAGKILDGIGSKDLGGVSRSWKSYALLTRALEFGDMTDDVIGEAIELSISALEQDSENALVTALAAQVQMKLAGDHDFGGFLAQRAVMLQEHNPFALHSATQAHLFAGEYKEAHEKAVFARSVASSLPNSYYWDLLCCFSALSIGQVEEARRYAIQAHSARPNYRPALRYLTALSSLVGRRSEAKIYAARLESIEPGFCLEHLLESSYPLETMRILGFGDNLATSIRAGI